jgi:alpha-beta hydrolase superfamily lysophospholipase
MHRRAFLKWASLGWAAAGPGRAVGYRLSTPTERPAIVIVCEGAGSLCAVSSQLRPAAAGTNLQVRNFTWTQGLLRILADQTNTQRARLMGQTLADVLRWVRHDEPTAYLSLLGFSAGAYIALLGAGQLPPATLDQIVLLAPSVSARFDVRPAIAACRGAVHVFASEYDIFALGIGVRLVGATDDRQCVRTAGRYGFDRYGDDPLYERLHHYFWTPDLAWTGYRGRHGDIHRRRFLQVAVVPLLLPLPTESAVCGG